MNPIVLIPARMGSTRLPGKPLADIGGMPMIVHVWRRALDAKVGPVWVAADHADIAQAIRQVGGQAILSKKEHVSGSDRIHEALTVIDPRKKHDVVINLQGDMPTIDPLLVQSVLSPLSHGADIATLACKISERDDRSNPNVVKVVMSAGLDETSLRGIDVKDGESPWRALRGRAGEIARALYFSRATVPHGRGQTYHHIGIYAYRREALERFVLLPPSPLEQQEKLEQLRALEAGMRIDVALAAVAPIGVDTPEQLEQVRKMVKA